MENEKEQKEEKQEFQKFTLDGDTYKTLLSKKWLAHKPYVVNDPGQVKSFIPGTILKVFVKEGQKIKTGESLLTLEAMKMHNLILSPVMGKIKKIHIAAGDKVANKQILVEIEHDQEYATKKVKEKKKKKRK